MKDLSQTGNAASSRNGHGHGLNNADLVSSPSSSPLSLRLSIRDHGAAPPVILMLIAIFPLGIASFIAASRWYDYRHHGWDIVFGSLLGTFFGWFAFRMYNLPIRRGGGWSWTARSRTHAFVSGLGFPSYTGSERWADGPVGNTTATATATTTAGGVAADDAAMSHQTDLEAGQFSGRDNGQSSAERPFVQEGAAHGHTVEV